MYYGCGALLGHFLMEAPKPVKKQPLNYPKNEEVAEKQVHLTLSATPRRIVIIH